jgi:hypothetical protein
MLLTVPKAKMMSEAVNSAQSGANSHALKTVSMVYHKNGNDNDRSLPLIFAHLADAVVQHEGVK